MRGSEKGAPPAAVVDWMALENEDWVPTFGILQNPEKAALVDALFREQAGCCVYCGRRLRRDEYGTRSHVDHFRPQTADKYPDLQLEHGNLFISCGPERDMMGTPAQTCGHVKKDWFDEDCHIDPGDYPCSRYFVFRSGGGIKGDGSDAATCMIEKLNLNDNELVVERRTTFDEVEAEIAESGDMVATLSFWDERDADGRELGFAYAVRRYFDVSMGG